MGVRAKGVRGPLYFLGLKVRLSRPTSIVLANATQTHVGTHDTDVNTQIHDTHTHALSRDWGLLFLGVLALAPGPPSILYTPSETGKLDPHQGK